MTTQPTTTTTTRRPYRGIGAALLVVACAAVCALPVLGGLIAGTFVDRLVDAPAWVIALIAVSAGIATLLVVRRRRASHGC